MKRQSITLFVFGMGIGAIVLMMVGFSANWVVTAGTAQQEAQRMAQEAMVENLLKNRDGRPCLEVNPPTARLRMNARKKLCQRVRRHGKDKESYGS